MFVWVNGRAVVRRAWAGVVAAVVLVGTGFLSGPAAAAPVGVSTHAQLASAFSSATGGVNPVQLAGDITVNNDDPETPFPYLEIRVPRETSVRLDLNGHDLNVTGSLGSAGVGVPATATLTIVDSEGGGSLTAVGEPRTAGIGGTVGGSAGTIIVSGGTIDATGGRGGAGIGGGLGGSGGTVVINAGTVTAQGGAEAAGIGGGEDGDGGTVTIAGGSVTAVGSVSGAGIGGGHRGDGGRVTITGGSVTANGGERGAGIGGGGSGNGGTVTITGGRVTADGGLGGAGIGGGFGGDGGTVTITDGSVTADGSVAAAGIGGGLDGAGADVKIGAGAQVTAQAGQDAAAVGASSGEPPGSLSNAGVLTIRAFEWRPGSPKPPAQFLLISGTVTNSGVLTGVGELTGSGTIVNSGAIAHTLTVDDTVVITEHNFVIDFDANGGSGAPGAMRVYATTLEAAQWSLPDQEPTREGYSFTGWYLTKDASGERFTDSTPFDSHVTLFAGWQPQLDELVLTPSNPDVQAGETVTFEVSGEGPAGESVDTSAATLFSNGPGVTVDGRNVTGTVVGEYTVTASLAGETATAVLVVVPAAAAVLDLRVRGGDMQVLEGDSTTLGVTATDDYGNPVDTSAVVLTSSVGTDVIDGLTVTFPTASPHTLTATLGDLSASVTIEVVPSPEAPVATPPPDTSGSDTSGSDTSGSDTSSDVTPVALPETGSPALGPALALAALLLLLGGVLLLPRRR